MIEKYTNNACIQIVFPEVQTQSQIPASSEHKLSSIPVRLLFEKSIISISINELKHDFFNFHFIGIFLKSYDAFNLSIQRIALFSDSEIQMTGKPNDNPSVHNEQT